MAVTNPYRLDQGGSGWKLLSPSGVAAWEQTGGAICRELVILSDEATFSVLTGSDEFDVDAAFLGQALPRGSYRCRFVAVTVTAGTVMLILE